MYTKFCNFEYKVAIIVARNGLSLFGIKPVEKPWRIRVILTCTKTQHKHEPIAFLQGCVVRQNPVHDLIKHKLKSRIWTRRMSRAYGSLPIGFEVLKPLLYSEPVWKLSSTESSHNLVFHSFFSGRRILLECCTEHSSDTSVICRELQRDSWAKWRLWINEFWQDLSVFLRSPEV